MLWRNSMPQHTAVEQPKPTTILCVLVIVACCLVLSEADDILRDCGYPRRKSIRNVLFKVRQTQAKQLSTMFTSLRFETQECVTKCKNTEKEVACDPMLKEANVRQCATQTYFLFLQIDDPSHMHHSSFRTSPNFVQSQDSKAVGEVEKVPPRENHSSVENKNEGSFHRLHQARLPPTPTTAHVSLVAWTPENH